MSFVSKIDDYFGKYIATYRSLQIKWKGFETDGLMASLSYQHA